MLKREFVLTKERLPFMVPRVIGGQYASVGSLAAVHQS